MPAALLKPLGCESVSFAAKEKRRALLAVKLVERNRSFIEHRGHDLEAE